jgi:hypothetical protein
MSIQLQAHIRHSWYGTKSVEENTAAIVTSLKVDSDYPPLDTKKHLIFTVDVSGSMSSSIPNLKATLLAVKDYLLVRDLFGKSVLITIVIYSDDANMIWSHFNDKGEVVNDVATYDVAVEKQIMALNYTNMDAGLTMANEWMEKLPKMPTWILVLTDGANNRGKKQNATAIGDYVQSVLIDNPLLTYMAFGYGQSFEAEVLKAIGNYTQIIEDKDIPEVFGSVTSEIISTVGFRAKIVTDVENQPQTVKQNVQVIAPLRGLLHPKYEPTTTTVIKDRHPKDIPFLYGTSSIGNLYQDRHYTCAMKLNFDVAKNPQGVVGKTISVEFIGWHANQWFQLRSSIMLTQDMIDVSTISTLEEGLLFLNSEISRFSDLIVSSDPQKLKQLNEALTIVNTQWIASEKDFPATVTTTATDLKEYQDIRTKAIDMLSTAIKSGGNVKREVSNAYSQMSSDIMAQNSHTEARYMNVSKMAAVTEMATAYDGYLHRTPTAGIINRPVVGPTPPVRAATMITVKSTPTM